MKKMIGVALLLALFLSCVTSGLAEETITGETFAQAQYIPTLLTQVDSYVYHF